MPELGFRIEAASALEPAASPHLQFQLSIEATSTGEGAVRSILLHSQIRIEPQLRSYDPACRGRMFDLFGRPEQWGRTLQSLYWTEAHLVVPGFRDRTMLDLVIPCSLDFNVAATRYFENLQDGEVPLSFQFRGTVFCSDAGGSVQISPIPQDRETTFRLPVEVWKEMMDRYYPRSRWLEIDRGVLDRLREYKERSGLDGWNDTFVRLLDGAGSRRAR